MDGQVGTSAWWYYTCFDPDLTPSQSGQDLTEYYQLVKSGLGKLMLNVERIAQPIAMHYSFPSANAVWITDGNSLKRPYSKNFDRFFENRNMWDRILSELGYQYSWIAHEQLEKGGLNTNKYKIFILPNSIALSKKEADEIRIFVQNGGILIADAQPGLMDEHAKWLKMGALDDVFGSPVAKGPVVNGYKITNYGNGKVYLLNKFVMDYKSDPALVSRISDAMTDAGIIAPVKIIAKDGKQLQDCETFYYKNSDIDYIGIVRGVVENKDKIPVTIVLSEKAFVYESLSGKFIGFTDKIQDELVSSDIRLYSILSEKAGKFLLKFNKNKVKQGDIVECTIFQNVSSAKDINYIMKIDVFQPDGTICQWNSKNILVPAKSGSTVRLNIALNEQKGKWRIKATNFQSGQSMENSFVVY